MTIKAEIRRATFRFARMATTSRGTLVDKPVSFILLRDLAAPEVFGIGECSLFPGLSADDRPDFDAKLAATVGAINEGADPELASWPSIAFGLETALADLEGGGRRLLFPSAFTEGRAAIPINGLIWMGGLDDMRAQIEAKLAEGFRCIKLKIGSAASAGGGGLDFEEEFDILSRLRGRYAPGDLEIRVDANGAFAPTEAMAKLERLATLGLHSIEQPIGAGQTEAMARLCATTPLPIALDEELIGISSIEAKRSLLDDIAPQYIILKPGLLGGLASADEWIGLASSRGIDWWATSALETNLGLNAIAQWTYARGCALRQGLSTGKLFESNIASPLELRGEELRYLPERGWDFSILDHGN
ncbi:MAG TPA: o-succinylbenzoate synthase [Rectinemataceae bacterium]|nr:o-succinylbenzoate synthase [Rectinemataceae bacterium]